MGMLPSSHEASLTRLVLMVGLPRSGTPEIQRIDAWMHQARLAETSGQTRAGGPLFTPRHISPRVHVTKSEDKPLGGEYCASPSHPCSSHPVPRTPLEMPDSVHRSMISAEGTSQEGGTFSVSSFAEATASGWYHKG